MVTQKSADLTLARAIADHPPWALHSGEFQDVCYFLTDFPLVEVTAQCASRENGSLRTEPARVTSASRG